MKRITLSSIIVLVLAVLASNTSWVDGLNLKESDIFRKVTPVSSPALDTQVLGDETRSEEKITVKRVVDGDTIVLSDGTKVRYIGIDTPETVDPRKSVQCFGKEASAENKKLVEGKEVRLEKDVSETDRYGRLLRYVWVGDTFVNDYLVKNGFAHASSYPPDVKYDQTFRISENYARENSLGLWRGCPLN